MFFHAAPLYAAAQMGTFSLSSQGDIFRKSRQTIAAALPRERGWM
jgi:hypothetical protein